MMVFHACSAFTSPTLRLWRHGPARAASVLQFDRTSLGVDAQGLHEFAAQLDHQVHEPVGFALVEDTADGRRSELPEHARVLPRLDQYAFPSDVWLAQGTARVLTRDPFAAAHDVVRVHVITARRYRGGQLYVWLPGEEGTRIAAAGSEDAGVFFDVPLQGRRRHLCAFKVVAADGRFEADGANRLWASFDGAEVWTHADTDAVVGHPPERRALTVHLRQDPALAPPRLHLWGVASDFDVDLDGIDEGDGQWRFTRPGLFTGHEYAALCVHGGRADDERQWEHQEAMRRLTLVPGADLEVWTLEGDHEIYPEAPAADRPLALTVVDRAPGAEIGGALVLDVWVNRARGLLHQGLTPDADGRYRLLTYPEVVTSFRFRSADAAESLDRHTWKLPVDQGPTPIELFVVLNRQYPLTRQPAGPLFRDPPEGDWIARPGAWRHGDAIRFALHAPEASNVEVVGEWTGWRARPVPMQSTRDGAYWWAEVPVEAVREGEFHGALYKFLIDGTREQQDPAADWVESSSPGHASKLVDHDRHVWRSGAWRTPSRDWLLVYQIHPRRFTSRFGGAGITPLDQVAAELTRPDGYLRSLGITAILLMPVNEFAGDDSWGYNPAFFYAVEAAYGGPEALKRFVDTCHAHGVAVILDVVFNHAGTSDNALWAVARDSYFAGDTSWGAMINFAHPQARHFFEQNVAALLRHYRVDGIRFDHTWTIRYSDRAAGHVTLPGSGGGWEFMHAMRRAAHAVRPDALLMAEHLPNEWDLTNFGGPMDTQWCDDFHDRIEDACRGADVMGRLADALRVTHTSCDEWYKATNYPESHDEVGNENDRLAQVGGWGRGLRRNKVAAAVTLCSRGIPMWFMGAEAGEHRQFLFSRSDTLDLDGYDTDLTARHVRSWWRALADLRRGHPAIVGPAPLTVHLAQQQLIVFSRGDGHDFVVVANFGGWSGWVPLAGLRVPPLGYRERLNSTWEPFAVEDEDAHVNADPRLGADDWLHVPDYGVVILERT